MAPDARGRLWAGTDMEEKSDTGHSTREIRGEKHMADFRPRSFLAGRRSQPVRTSPQIFNVFDENGWIEQKDPAGNSLDEKPIVVDPLNGATINFLHYRRDYRKEPHRHTCSNGVYVIDGEMKVDERVYGPGSFIWDPAGCLSSHGTAPGEECRMLHIANLPFDTEYLAESETLPKNSTVSQEPKGVLQNHEASREPVLQTFNFFDGRNWIEKEEPIGSAFFDKPMIVDPETGMVINFSRYPAGFNKPAHSYNCAHGIYIIRGIMNTADGTLGPGNFIWYPAGYVSEQLTAADEDCLFLFVTNRSYTVRFQ